MPSRILIFDVEGKQIAELNADFRRTWRLNAEAPATYTVSNYDPKTVSAFIEYGRYIHVEHDKLGVWSGMIDPPRDWGYHKVQVTAYSGEHILKFMRSPLNFKSDGAPGSIVADLIADSDGFHEILSMGSIYSEGKHIKQEAHLNTLYDLVAQWAKDAKNDWDVTGIITGGRIRFNLNWYEKKGEIRLIRLDENLNIELSDKPMREQGEIYNDIWGYDSDKNSWNDCMKSHVIDTDSAGRYSWRYGTFAHGYSSKSGSDKATQAQLDKLKSPRKTFDFSALDVGSLYANLRIGDTLPVHLVSVGFQGGGFGVDTTARILGMTYNDLDNKVQLVLDEAL
jgi:hypothetical protein